MGDGWIDEKKGDEDETGKEGGGGGGGVEKSKRVGYAM